MSAQLNQESWAVLAANLPLVRYSVRRCLGPAIRRAAWAHDVHYNCYDVNSFVDGCADAALPTVYLSVRRWVEKGRPGRVSSYIFRSVLAWIRRGNQRADRKQNRQAAEFGYARAARSKSRLRSSASRAADVLAVIDTLRPAERQIVRKRFGLWDRPEVAWGDLTRTEQVRLSAALRKLREVLK